MPAGLADGLALKKLRYGQRSDSPLDSGLRLHPVGPPPRLRVESGLGVFI